MTAPETDSELTAGLCPRCAGTGRDATVNIKCWKCSGTGAVVTRAHSPAATIEAVGEVLAEGVFWYKPATENWFPTGTKLYTHPAPAATMEPVAWAYYHDGQLDGPWHPVVARTRWPHVPEPWTEVPLAPAAPALEADGLGDHERGCQGREYTCTCGYDERAAAAVTQLRERCAELERITDRLDADLSTSDGHREAAESRLATVERERDTAVKERDAMAEGIEVACEVLTGLDRDELPDDTDFNELVEEQVARANDTKASEAFYILRSNELDAKLASVERERDERPQTEMVRRLRVDFREQVARAEAAEAKILALTGELKRIAASDGGADRLRYMANVALYGQPTDAALEAASSAQAPEGYRLVPIAALEWLNGSGPDADGNWFGDTTPPTKGKYWWRSHFMAMLDTAAPQPPAAQAPDA